MSEIKPFEQRIGTGNKEANPHVGKVFTARKSYPLLSLKEALKAKSDPDFTYDIKTGEKVFVESYDEETNSYKLVNHELSEDGEAWVTVSEEELLTLKRRNVK